MAGFAPALSGSDRRLLPVVGGFLLLLLIAAASIWIGISSRKYNMLVAHTLRVRSAAYLLLTLVQDAETGQRGYLLTDDPTYLAPYREGADHALGALADLESLTRENVTERGVTEGLRRLVTEKLAELASTVAANQQEGREAALAIVKNNTGNTFMTEIRQRVAAVQAEESRTIGTVDAETRDYGVLLGWFSAGGVLVVIALGALIIVTTRRVSSELQRAQVALQANNDNLEGLVTARVADLQAANDEIQRFAYIVSHDLRAPLVNVMGFTSELEAARAEISALLRPSRRRLRRSSPSTAGWRSRRTCRRRSASSAARPPRWTG